MMAACGSLLADLESASPKGGDGVVALLEERGVTPVDVAGWQRIDAAERALGARAGRERTTMHDRDELFDAARA